MKNTQRNTKNTQQHNKNIQRKYMKDVVNNKYLKIKIQLQLLRCLLEILTKADLKMKICLKIIFESV